MSLCDAAPNGCRRVQITHGVREGYDPHLGQLHDLQRGKHCSWNHTLGAVSRQQARARSVFGHVCLRWLHLQDGSEYFEIAKRLKKLFQSKFAKVAHAAGIKTEEHR